MILWAVNTAHLLFIGKIGMKKIISVFLSAVFLMILIPWNIAFATDSDFVIEDGVLMSYNGTSAIVNIPSDVTSIADEAFMGNTKIITKNYQKL